MVAISNNSLITSVTFKKWPNLRDVNTAPWLSLVERTTDM